jgi:HSP20 family molecular chaperone IbpA
MEVQDTLLKDGILSITIKMEIPETKKPKKVEINVG